MANFDLSKSMAVRRGYDPRETVTAIAQNYIGMNPVEPFVFHGISTAGFPQEPDGRICHGYERTVPGRADGRVLLYRGPVHTGQSGAPAHHGGELLRAGDGMAQRRERLLFPVRGGGGPGPEKALFRPASGRGKPVCDPGAEGWVRVWLCIRGGEGSCGSKALWSALGGETGVSGLCVECACYGAAGRLRRPGLRHD